MAIWLGNNEGGRRLNGTDYHEIVLDLPMEDPMDDLEALGKYNLRFKLIEKRGPAGGNPLVELSGRVDNLRAWLTEWYFSGDPNCSADVELHLWGDE